MNNQISFFIYDENGATAVEYALMVAFISVLIILAVTFLGNTIANIFRKVGENVAEGWTCLDNIIQLNMLIFWFRFSNL